MTKKKWAIHHAEDDGCNKIAFYIDFEPSHNDMLTAKSVSYADGRNVEDGDNIVCGACGKMMSYVNYQDAEEVTDGD